MGARGRPRPGRSHRPEPRPVASDETNLSAAAHNRAFIDRFPHRRGERSPRKRQPVAKAANDVGRAANRQDSCSLPGRADSSRHALAAPGSARREGGGSSAQFEVFAYLFSSRSNAHGRRSAQTPCAVRETDSRLTSAGSGRCEAREVRKIRRAAGLPPLGPDEPEHALGRALAPVDYAQRGGAADRGVTRVASGPGRWRNPC